MNIDDRPVALVAEFHEAAGLPVRGSPEAKLPTIERRKLESLLDSEIAELLRALRGGIDSNVPQVIGVADALGDIVYVVIGAALQLGIDICSAALRFAEDQAVVPNTTDGETLTLDDLAELYWSKKSSPVKRPPMVLALRAYRRKSDQGLVDDVDSLVESLTQARSTFKSGLRSLDEEVLKKSLGQAILICYEIAVRLGFHLGTVLEEIHRSNMTKIPSGREVIRRDDGKILKPDTFVPPDLRNPTGPPDSSV